MKNSSWFLLFFLFPAHLFSGTTTYTYSIHYAGLPVARTIITHDDTDSLQTITVETSSKGLISALFTVENTYVSSSNSDFLPLFFWKTIHQQNVQEKKIVVFHEDTSAIEIRDLLAQRKDILKTETPIYDIVSFTFGLLNQMPDEKSYNCYGNYRLWKMETQIKDTVVISYDKKNYECALYKITSKLEYDSGIDSKTDILTNNIFKPNSITYYWVRPDDNVLLRAQYKRFPFSIFLYLKDIEIM